VKNINDVKIVNIVGNNEKNIGSGNTRSNENKEGSNEGSNEKTGKVRYKRDTQINVIDINGTEDINNVNNYSNTGNKKIDFELKLLKKKQYKKGIRNENIDNDIYETKLNGNVLSPKNEM